MANARKTAARKARRAINRGDRIKATPETLAKLRPHPLELLLARGREGGGIDADQWQCAEEIIAARDAFAAGLGFNSNDLQSMISLGFAASIGSYSRAQMSPHDERLCAIWLAWADELNRRWNIRRPFIVVERIESTLPCPPPLALALGAALDLWAKVRREMDRAAARGSANTAKPP
jgi:hypothetical protein